LVIESSPKSKDRLNYKVLLIILASGVTFQIFNSIIPEREHELDLINNIISASTAITSISAFYIAKRYHGSDVFGKAYLALGAAYLVWFIGDMIWNYEEIILKVHAYPSPSDIFYFAFYPFASFYLIRNIFHWKQKFSLPTKILAIALPPLIIAIYTYLTYHQGGITNFDYYYGLIFVVGAAITFPLAILGVQVYKQSRLAVVWALIAVGILLNVIADDWQYYLEIFQQFHRVEVISALWFTSNMIIIYALYKHRKAI